jgi:hypothetical protein
VERRQPLVIRFHAAKPRQRGRGLVFWFRPDIASIAELPLDDRETTIFVSGRSSDFRSIPVRGALVWRVAEPERLTERIDFTLSLTGGKHLGGRKSGSKRAFPVVKQATLDYLAAADVRALLDAGIEPLQRKVGEALATIPAITELGLEIVSTRLQNLTPGSERERALQTPTIPPPPPAQSDASRQNAGFP